MPLPFLPHGIAGLVEQESDKTAIVLELPPSESSVINFDGLTPDSARELGKTLARERGWTKQEFDCVERLWTKESNWRWQADNPKSSAYGIPQILGLPESLTPRQQIIRGYEYIEHRYGSACRAMDFWLRNFWY